MVLRRIVRPQAITRQWAQLSQSLIQHQRRSIHKVPALGGQNNEKATIFKQNGVPGFLSPRTYRQVWEQYQLYLVDQINATVVDTEYADKSSYQMHVEVSRQPEHADFYNIVAMAHFNHLWWESLSPEKKVVPDLLRRDIEEDFHSVENLQDEMLELADAMFGNGFVWLMKEFTPGATSHAAHQKLRLLCTYNAGSPYTEAWRMRQNRESITLADPTAQGEARREAERRSKMREVQNSVGSFGPNSRQARDGYHTPNALFATPLLCLNVWQHMYVPDYGILGKRQYMAAWWERIDWDVVAQRHQQVARASFGRS